MLAGVHPAAVNFVESCQPYHGDAGPAYHVLTTLRVLSNEDKHRTLLPAFTAIEGRPELIDLKVVGVRDVREPVERGQVYARRPLNDLDVVLESAVEITGPDPEVRMEGELPLDVAFGSKRMPLGGLRQMVDMIAAVIAEARVFFGQ